MEIAELLLRLSGENAGADEAVRGLKDRLASLSDKKVTVDIDDRAARVKIDALARKLHDLQSQVKVGVKDDALDAKIAAVQAKIDSLRGKTVDVKVNTDQANGALDALKSKWGAIGLAAATVGPQILGALGQATLGAGALSVGVAGATSAFGVLGMAVKGVLSGQSGQAAALHELAKAQKQLAKDQATGNQALIQADQQHIASLKQQLDSQNALAQHVNMAWGRVQQTMQTAMAPAVQSVLHGLSTALHTIGTNLMDLQGPFQVLGDAVRKALSSPATQAGIKSLIDGFGAIVKASAPLAGPLVKMFIDLGKIFEHLALAAMPALVKVTKEFVGWLDKIANSTGNTDRLRGQIQKLSDEFVAIVKDVFALGKALLPLFQSAAGFQPLIGAVIAVISGFTHLLASLGPVGRLLAGGLGIALIATRFSSLKTLIGLLATGFKTLAVAAIEPLLTMFPGLVSVFWGADAAITGGAAALGAAALAAAPFILAAAGIVAVVLLVIKFHKQLEAVVVAVWHAIEAVVTTVWNFMKDHIKTIMEAIFVIVTGGFGAVVLLIIHFHKQIEEAVKAAWDWVLHAIEDAWKLIEKAVTTGVAAVVKVVTKLPGEVLKGLGDIGSFLFNAGKQLVMGFIHGVESLFGDIVNVGKGIVDSIGNAVTSLLGIASPSKVAQGWGEAVGNGIVKGLANSHLKVRAAALKLASMASLTGVGAAVAPVGAGFQQGSSGGLEGMVASGVKNLIQIIQILAPMGQAIKDINKLLPDLVKIALSSDKALATLVRLASPAVASGTSLTGGGSSGGGSLSGGGHGGLMGLSGGVGTVGTADTLTPGQGFTANVTVNAHALIATPQVQRQIASTVTEALRRQTPTMVKR